MSLAIYACLGLGLAAALVAGVFQSFSDFVMRGLNRAAPQGGMQSMQELNRTVFRSAFLVIFLALVPATLAFSVYAFVAVNGPAKALIMVATLVYFVFSFVVTMVGNVPMNRHLDGLDHTSASAYVYWAKYGRVWTWWNHLRTAGSVVAALCLLLASVQLASGESP